MRHHVPHPGQYCIVLGVRQVEHSIGTARSDTVAAEDAPLGLGPYRKYGSPASSGSQSRARALTSGGLGQGMA
jgi:hypothetical protein